MLRKLLKQEFRATARVMLPLYLVTFVLALAVRLVLLLSQNQVLLDSVGGRTLRAVLLGVSVTAFVVATIATFLAALIQAVLRFRSNLLGDEGYVMFTLPVSTHQLVWAKLITSVVWFLGAAVIDVLALLALVVNLGMLLLVVGLVALVITRRRNYKQAKSDEPRVIHMDNGETFKSYYSK